MEIVDKIRKSLFEANQELTDAKVVAFWLEADPDELSNKNGLVANVVYIVEKPKQKNKGSWEIDTLDDFCELVSSKLENYVIYTNCWYRSKTEFNISDFQKDRHLYEIAS